jgi:hypothetical protein
MRMTAGRLTNITGNGLAHSCRLMEGELDRENSKPG